MSLSNFEGMGLVNCTSDLEIERDLVNARMRKWADKASFRLAAVSQDLEEIHRTENLLFDESKHIELCVNKALRTLGDITHLLESLKKELSNSK